MTPYVTQETITARTVEWLKRIEPYNQHDLQLNVSKSALMVVDMQMFFLEPGAPTFTCGGVAILPALKRMIEAFRKAGRPVIFTRHVHHPAVLPELEIRAGSRLEIRIRDVEPGGSLPRSQRRELLRIE